MPMQGTVPQTSLDSILFATDLCPTSATAATWAAAMARRFRSTLELVTLVDLSMSARFGHGFMGPALDAMRHTGEEGLARLAGQFSGIRVRTSVAQGFTAADLILDAAWHAHSDLIVLPPSVVKRLMTGSPAEDVIRRAACPVLSIGPEVRRTPGETISVHRILCAADRSPQAKKVAQYAFGLAETLSAELSLVHVLSPEEEKAAREQPEVSSPGSLQHLVPETPSSHCHPECVMEHGRAAEAILRLAQQAHADMIVLGARKCSAWLATVKSGVTPALLAHAPCPVLSVC